MRWPLLALGSVFCALSAFAAPAPEGRFVPFTPLSLKELYAKRMRFLEGEPMISVGIMEGQKVVRLRADGPVRVMFDEAGLPKTVYAPPDTPFTFQVLKSNATRLRHWVIVESFPYGDEAAADAGKARWATEHPATLFEVGTIVALAGKVLDTRQRQLGIGGFAKRADAEKLVSQLSTDRGLRTFVHEELVGLPDGVIAVIDEKGRTVAKAEGSVYFGTVEGGRIQIADVEHSRGYADHGRQTRSFWGHVYVALDRDGKLTVVNSVGAEQLLGGLVPAEIFATAPIEALKAQAVTARGEIFSKLGHRHFGEPYHLCSEQHCQVYAGAGFERPETNRAVEATRGLLAVRPRTDPALPLHLVDSVYSSMCGGHSEANEVVWDNVRSESLRPKLDGVSEDPALAAFRDGLSDANIRAWLEAYPPADCARSSFARADKFRWKKRIAQPLLDRLTSKYGIGRLKQVDILGRGPGGRITGLRLSGTAGHVDVLRELPVRRLFGNLSSGMFVLDQERDAAGRLIAITFTGGGWGHGVGMCQIGAIGRAERGQTFEQILGHYYSGAVVERIY